MSFNSLNRCGKVEKASYVGSRHSSYVGSRHSSLEEEEEEVVVVVVVVVEVEGGELGVI